MLFLNISLIFCTSESWSFSWGDGGVKNAVDAAATAEHIAAAAVDSMACTDENKTFTVDLKVHAQDLVIRSIHSIAESESVEAYFGTIIDELNVFLMKFKVQFHLNLDGYNTDDFMGTNAAFDISCEKTSPVIERTSSAFSFYLKQSFTDNIGIHLFIWACPYISSTSELETVYSNLRCGRVMGVLWKGAAETRALIKGVILNALTGSAHAFSASDGSFDASVGPRLCKYVNQCVGMDKSEIGQLVLGTELVKYTGAV
ncbi:spore wall protein 7-like [Ctenocephalides felis]|uniref:spore wall protein 7-like n=1 Tax=Ctenocephalides felis TaxID=7515 RepID=UPI000E6E2039|nr:spore wall protein 7-like [Ctenocephalides felis]